MSWSGLPPGDSSPEQARIDAIVSFWNAVRASEDPGSTTWEVLEELEQQVTDCLWSEPPEVDRAEGLTAKALFLIGGIHDP